MSEKKFVKKEKSVNADWFVQGILSKIGDVFDRMTGRGSGKGSSLSTSELNERLKSLLDSEVKDFGEKGKFVPHNIKLKMQWNKFSTDSEAALKKLENELLTAAIDHINDNLYHLYKPFKIEVKPDYFTEGIKFLASFEEFGEEETEVEMQVTVPQIKVQGLIPEVVQQEPDSETYIIEFTVGEKSKSVELKFNDNKKRMSVGRTKENDLVIEDPSISKIHAALVLNPQKMLLVADTGSTNGTFINGERIAYGRAFPVNEGDKVKFGTVEVFLRRVPKSTDFETKEAYEPLQLPSEDSNYEPPPTESSHLATRPTEEVHIQPKTSEMTQNMIQMTDESVIAPTEAFQMQTQKVDDFNAQNIQPAIPKPTESNVVQEQPKTVSNVLAHNENHAEQKAIVPVLPTDLNNTNVENEEANLSEPRVKLNFDE